MNPTDLEPGTEDGAAAAPAPERPRGPRLVESPKDKATKQGDQDPYGPQSADAARKLIQECIDDAAHNPARLERDLQDIGNQRVYRGGPRNQWIYRSASNPNQWVERPYDGPDGLPAWVPRCCTNHFANKIDGVVSILVQSDPAKTARPATNDDSDIAAANVADRVLPVLEEEIEWRELKRHLSHLIALQDKAAVLVYYDNDPKHGTADLPIYVCADCAQDPANETGGMLESWEIDDAGGVCPNCGGSNLSEFVNPETGLVEGLTYAKGKMCATVINSLGFSVPSGATTVNSRKLPWILLHDGEDVNGLCAQFPDHAEAIRNVSSRGRKGASQQATAFAEELRTMSSPSSTARSAGGGGNAKAGPVVVYRLQHDPIESEDFQFPEGLYAIMVGDVLLEHGPLPVTDSRTGQKRKSILLRTYRDMPGSPFGKPVGDDLFPLQLEHNQLKTLAFMSAMHHAAPTTFLPSGVTLEDELTGQPGAVVRYRSHGQAEPSLQQGSGVHPTVYELMDRNEHDMDSLSGLNAVLQGATPEGGKTTAFEIQTLQERGMAAFRTPLDNAVDFERELAILLLDIARESIWVQRFQKVMGESGQWDIEQFLGADLTGNVDIVIDPMSAWPKSPMLQDARLTRAVEMGALQIGDPELSSKVLDMLSLGDMKPSLNEDKKQVARELDRWRAATTPDQIAPPNLAVIEPAIHLFLKKQFLKTEGVELLAQQNPAVFQAMVMHVQMLQMALAPPPMADPNAPPDGSAVHAAVSSGALVPEGATPKANPLEAAIQGGALSPEMPAAAGPSIDELMAAGVMTPAPQEAPAR